MKPEILTLDDVRLMVDTFYSHVRGDELIGPIFNDTIGDHWPEHLEKLHCFWQTVLLGEHTYTGSPFPPHFKLGLDKPHFDRWLRIFHATVDELFSGKKAEEAKQRSVMMAEIFRSKLARNPPA